MHISISADVLEDVAPSSKRRSPSSVLLSRVQWSPRHTPSRRSRRTGIYPQTAMSVISRTNVTLQILSEGPWRRNVTYVLPLKRRILNIRWKRGWYLFCISYVLRLFSPPSFFRAAFTNASFAKTRDKRWTFVRLKSTVFFTLISGGANNRNLINTRGMHICDTYHYTGLSRYMTYRYTDLSWVKKNLDNIYFFEILLQSRAYMYR